MWVAQIIISKHEYCSDVQTAESGKSLTDGVGAIQSSATRGP